MKMKTIINWILKVSSIALILFYFELVFDAQLYSGVFGLNILKGVGLGVVLLIFMLIHKDDFE